MDRLHFERAGFAATEADEELGRRAEADQFHIATMVEADGNGLGSCRRRPDRKGNGGAHLLESVRRQSLHTRRFVRTDRSAEPTSVSHTRPLHSRCSPGSLTIEAVKGFEYEPSKQTVQVEAGEIHSVTLTLKRMTNLKAKGWYSGSNHVHMNYAGNLHNTPENLFVMNAAEDADFISWQIANKDNRILDYQHYTPRQSQHPLSTKDRITHVGQEYRPPFWGHISLFNLRDHLISPFVTGYEATAIESLYPSNTDIFRYAKEQGGIGAYVHPFSGNADPLAADLGAAKGFPVDLALEAISYHELWSQGAGDAPLNVWYHALNNGFKVPVVGGEDWI